MEVKLIDGLELTRETVVKQYQGLVHKHANRLSGDDYHIRQDLVQEGYVGLIYAFDRFDPETGYRFMTFASPYVWGYMMRLQGKRGLIQAPENVVQLAWKIEREGLWESTDEAIAEKLEENKVTVTNSRKYFDARVVFSFDKENSSSDDEGTDYYNLEGVAEDFTSPIVEDYLKLLTDKEVLVVEYLVAGFNQPQIGEMLGITKAGAGWLVKGIRKKIKTFRERLE